MEEIRGVKDPQHSVTVVDIRRALMTWHISAAGEGSPHTQDHPGVTLVKWLCKCQHNSRDYLPAYVLCFYRMLLT